MTNPESTHLWTLTVRANYHNKHTNCTKNGTGALASNLRYEYNASTHPSIAPCPAWWVATFQVRVSPTMTGVPLGHDGH